jgi:hypothetical protein
MYTLILAMFCSIDEKTAGESHFVDFQKRSFANWPLASHSANATPQLWNFIGLQPLSALLRDLADTSACFS